MGQDAGVTPLLFLNTCKYLKKYIPYVCLYIYINKYTQNTKILCKQNILFCIQLIAINRLTAFIYTFACMLFMGVTIHRYIDTMYDDTMHRCHA